MEYNGLLEKLAQLGLHKAGKLIPQAGAALGGMSGIPGGSMAGGALGSLLNNMGQQPQEQMMQPGQMEQGQMQQGQPGLQGLEGLGEGNGLGGLEEILMNLIQSMPDSAFQKLIESRQMRNSEPMGQQPQQVGY